MKFKKFAGVKYPRVRVPTIFQSLFLSAAIVGFLGTSSWVVGAALILTGSKLASS